MIQEDVLYAYNIFISLSERFDVIPEISFLFSEIHRSFSSSLSNIEQEIKPGLLVPGRFL